MRRTNPIQRGAFLKYDSWAERIQNWASSGSKLRERVLKLTGQPFLGQGQSRIVVSVPEGALKFAWGYNGILDNKMEYDLWHSAPEPDRDCLVPVIEMGTGGQWLLMEEVDNKSQAEVNNLKFDKYITPDEPCLEVGYGLGLLDLHAGNFAKDGRIVDYAMNPAVGFLYHVTYARFLEDILDHGLTPQGGGFVKGGYAYAGHSKGKTFATVAEGISYWFNKLEEHVHGIIEPEEIEDQEYVPVVLRFRAEVADWSVDELGTRDARQEAFSTTETIPADDIQVWDGDSWVPIYDHDLLIEHALTWVEEEDGDWWEFNDDSPFMPPEAK